MCYFSHNHYTVKAMETRFGPASLVLLAVLLAGCARTSAVCDTDPPNAPVELRQMLDLDTSQAGLAPFEIEIGNQIVRVDHLVHGPVCDVDWNGTVYVDCDVEVAEWDEKPFFFEGCDVNITEDAVIYVAYHNDEAYYNGCSCHFIDE